MVKTVSEKRFISKDEKPSRPFHREFRIPLKHGIFSYATNPITFAQAITHEGFVRKKINLKAMTVRKPRSLTTSYSFQMFFRNYLKSILCNINL